MDQLKMMPNAAVVDTGISYQPLMEGCDAQSNSHMNVSVTSGVGKMACELISTQERSGKQQQTSSQTPTMLHSIPQMSNPINHAQLTAIGLHQSPQPPQSQAAQIQVMSSHNMIPSQKMDHYSPNAFCAKLLQELDAGHVPSSPPPLELSPHKNSSSSNNSVDLHYAKMVEKASALPEAAVGSDFGELLREQDRFYSMAERTRTFTGITSAESDLLDDVELANYLSPLPVAHQESELSPQQKQQQPYHYPFQQQHRPQEYQEVQLQHRELQQHELFETQQQQDIQQQMMGFGIHPNHNNMQYQELLDSSSPQVQAPRRQEEESPTILSTVQFDNRRFNVEDYVAVHGVDGNEYYGIIGGFYSVNDTLGNSKLNESLADEFPSDSVYFSMKWLSPDREKFRRAVAEHRDVLPSDFLLGMCAG
jgi:hypothetical protein